MMTNLFFVYICLITICHASINQGSIHGDLKDHVNNIMGRDQVSSELALNKIFVELDCPDPDQPYPDEHEKDQIITFFKQTNPKFDLAILFKFLTRGASKRRLSKRVNYVKEIGKLAHLIIKTTIKHCEFQNSKMDKKEIINQLDSTQGWLIGDKHQIKNIIVWMTLLEQMDITHVDIPSLIHTLILHIGNIERKTKNMKSISKGIKLGGQIATGVASSSLIVPPIGVPITAVVQGFTQLCTLGYATRSKGTAKNNMEHILLINWICSKTLMAEMNAGTNTRGSVLLLLEILKEFITPLPEPVLRLWNAIRYKIKSAAFLKLFESARMADWQVINSNHPILRRMFETTDIDAKIYQEHNR